MDLARVVLRVVLLAAAMAATAAAAPAATYVVALEGDDANQGTMAQPWRTIGKAAQTLGPGDTVYVRAGTYGERVAPQRSGAPGKYITYAAYPGDVVTIDGDGLDLDTREGLFDIHEREFIRVTGLRVVNSPLTGIAAVRSRQILIDGNHTYNTASSGIGIWGSEKVVVEGNEVELACTGRGQECITIAGSTHILVADNHVHNGAPEGRGGEGIDAKDGSCYVIIRGNHVHNLSRLGIYVDAWRSDTHDIDVIGNTVHDCAGCGLAAASERGGLLQRVRFLNNVVYRNRSAGIAVAGWNGEYDHPIHNVKIVNNTIYDNGWPGHSWGGGIAVQAADVRDILIRNNVCSRNRDWQIRVDADPARVVVDHNLIDGYRAHANESRGTAHVEGDPLFVSPETGDFRLRARSPAIDIGSSVDAPDSDIDGKARPVGKACDIGAHEFQEDGTGR
jgi:hypothetical protein